MNSVHIISQSLPIIGTIRHINEINDEPLVLFVANEDCIMRGMLTDGDVHCTSIRGISINAPTADAMHCNFNFLRTDVNDRVEGIHKQHGLRMRLVPVLDDNNRICEIINLERYRTKLPIDAVLMAGGKGERLRPLTERTPKPLIRVGDGCIIDYNINRLLTYGVSHVSVTVNYLKTQTEEHFREKHQGIKIATVCEPECLGTVGSIKFVEKFYNDTVLVMNFDLFTNIGYEDFYLHFQQHDADMSVAAVPYAVRIPYGILDLSRHEIRGVVEKPTYNYYTSAGIYLIERDYLDLVPENELFNATDFIDRLIVSRHKVIRYPISGFWIDTGQHEELARTEEMIKRMKGF